MAIRFGTSLVVLFGSLVAYLASLNNSAVRIFLTPGLQFEIPLWALLVGVTSMTVLGTLMVVLLWDTVRALHERRARPRGDVLAERAALTHSGLEGREFEESPGAPHYAEGKAALEAGDFREALHHLKEALRADKFFAPAYLAMGEAFEHVAERKEAIRAWERGAELVPIVPILKKLEDVNRAESRPSRMIQLYQDAIARAPDNQELAFHLGRVYFELSMLDDAADQFTKIEASLPDFPPVHAYLGAIYERRGQIRHACEEYSKALRSSLVFEWPHVCRRCGAAARAWQDRCASCGRWNSLHSS